MSKQSRADLTSALQKSSASTAYNSDSVSSFCNYFIKPAAKKKRGRPSKKLHWKSRVKLQSTQSDQGMGQVQTMMDGNSKSTDALDARLEGALASTATRRVRRNWKKEPYKSHLKRVTDSWLNQKDLWQPDPGLTKAKSSFLNGRFVICYACMIVCFANLIPCQNNFPHQL